ncbi:MAG: hypothetical protein U0984_13715 [Prosthecobacter sp.]|nr:hypothetical protein [Prosthecobacter sp.]
MDFDSALHLQKATGRAKSDVANKLVSMVLHDISSRVAAAGGASVKDPAYQTAVVAAFGKNCVYCSRSLEHDRAANEHLEGMNRVRVGLHIPGNVAVACVTCNREKRRDDMNVITPLADTGWESFLSHDGGGDRCVASCKTCAYWAAVWPSEVVRKTNLTTAIKRIRHFRLPYQRFTTWNVKHRPVIQAKVEALYRECQAFAKRGMEELTAGTLLDFEALQAESASAAGLGA